MTSQHIQEAWPEDNSLTLVSYLQYPYFLLLKRSIWSVAGWEYDWGSHSSRFYWDSPGFIGFKELHPGVPQTLVWDAKCPGFLQVIKIQLF
jgi:hypothetical protein